MIENLFEQSNDQLKARLNELGYQPASQLASTLQRAPDSLQVPHRAAW